MREFLLLLISVFGGTLAGYLLNARKSKAEISKLKAETKKTEVDEFLCIMEYWKKTAIEFEKKTVELQQKVDEYQSEVDRLRKYNARLVKKLDEYEKAGHAGDSLHGHTTG